jgi:hypothetical protein
MQRSTTGSNSSLNHTVVRATTTNEERGGERSNGSDPARSRQFTRDHQTRESQSAPRFGVLAPAPRFGVTVAMLPVPAHRNRKFLSVDVSRKKPL